MTPYQVLKQSVSRKGGTCSLWEVRSQWDAYFATLRIKVPPIVVMTREEYQELCNRRKKRLGKKKVKTDKGTVDPVLFTYESLDAGNVEVKRYHPKMDTDYEDDLAFIDEVARKQREEEDGGAYYGAW